MNFWEVLGIAPTADRKLIKRAFSEKSRLLHPEEHPDEFRRLHEAYRTAIRTAAFLEKVSDSDQTDSGEDPDQTAGGGSLTESGDSEKKKVLINPGDRERDSSGTAEAGKSPADLRAISLLQKEAVSGGASDQTAGAADDSAAEPQRDSGILSILQNELNPEEETAELLLKEFLEAADTLNCSPDQNSHQEWLRLFHHPRYQTLLQSRFFEDRLSTLSEENHPFGNAFYSALSEYFRYTDLENTEPDRAQPGFSFPDGSVSHAGLPDIGSLGRLLLMMPLMVLVLPLFIYNILVRKEEIYWVKKPGQTGKRQTSSKKTDLSVKDRLNPVIQVKRFRAYVKEILNGDRGIPAGLLFIVWIILLIIILPLIYYIFQELLSYRNDRTYGHFPM